MTLTERRAQLAERLQEYRAAQDRARTAFVQLSSQIDQLMGAIAVVDQLIAEEGNSHVVGVESAAASHGNEIRAGEGVKEWEGVDGRFHDDDKAAS